MKTITVQEVTAYMEQLAPPALAEEWDNVGLLVDCGGAVTGILTALEITHAVVQEACALGCNLIVAHHPVIFRPLKKIGPQDVAYHMVRSGVSAVCMHTNLDAAQGGVNDVLAALIGLQDVRPFGTCGRVGALGETLTAAQLAARCERVLGACVRLADAQKPVSVLAVVGGSGGDFAPDALAGGADCLLTGEASHHQAMDALAAGLSVIAAGHYETEAPIARVLAQTLHGAFASIPVHSSTVRTSPFTTVSTAPCAAAE